MTETLTASGTRHRAVVVSVSAITLCAGGFVAVAAAFESTWIQTIDENWLRAIRAAETTNGPSWTLTAARDLTALGSLWVMAPIVVSVCVFLALELRFVSLAWILGTTASGYGLSKALKVLFQRARPDLVPHLAPASGYSFPSGHSMVSAVVYFTLAFLITHSRCGRAHQIFALAIAFLVTGIVGTTRVYLGVHYPSDVLAGWLAGAAWATAGWLVATTTDRVGVSPRAAAVEKK